MIFGQKVKKKENNSAFWSSLNRTRPVSKVEVLDFGLQTLDLGL